jgi:hypothetical protein
MTIHVSVAPDRTTSTTTCTIPRTTAVLSKTVQ